MDLENATYFLGRESVVITKYTGMSPFRESLFDFLGRNSARVSKYFNLPFEKVFEIGSRIRLWRNKCHQNNIFIFWVIIMNLIQNSLRGISITLIVTAKRNYCCCQHFPVFTVHFAKSDTFHPYSINSELSLLLQIPKTVIHLR